MRGIMIQGTSSDAGKSLITTAFCRLFAIEEKKVTPFKSQNMSNNSYVTVDGKEIGRAQGIQAESAMTEAAVWMNPILLKPRSDLQSEVVLFGESVKMLSGRDYRETFYEKGLEAIQSSLAYLEKEYDLVIIEGAGSPAEINLNDRELVNMKVAELADVPVILVADIERGGVFANIVGTLELLSSKERKRVQGLIINKFRGDVALFQDGVKWLEEKTGIPVLGVLPYIDNHGIDGEDSLSIKNHYGKRSGAIDIAVIDVTYLSNYSDIESFVYEKDVSIRFVKESSEFGNPDAVIILDTQNTLHGMNVLREKKLDQQISSFVKAGGYIVGISSGFQIMGTEIIDQTNTDAEKEIGVKQIKGMDLISARTFISGEKDALRVRGKYHSHTKIKRSKPMEGYEIHSGKTEILEEAGSFLELDSGRSEGYYGHNGKIIGTYVHHLFHHDEWRNTWLNAIRSSKGLPAKEEIATKKLKEERFNRLALTMKDHLNWEKIKAITYGWKRK